MRILLDAHAFGWRMTGLLGKDAEWFCGFSKRPKEPEVEPRLVSYAIDGSTCTLNIGDEEHYYDRIGTTANAEVQAAAEGGRACNDLLGVTGERR